jgi:hypothetical protein
LAAVRSKIGVKIGRHSGEIAQSFEIRAALEVALIERKNEPETVPLGIDKPLLLNKVILLSSGRSTTKPSSRQDHAVKRPKDGRH